MKYKDYSNVKLNENVIILYKTTEKKRHEYLWQCKCLICNNEFKITSSRFRAKYAVKSCGCYKPCGKDSKTFKGFNEISLSMFTRIKRSAKERNLEFNITIEDMWNLFLKQNKKCALSGVDLIFPKKIKNKGTASLDRINSNYGYVLNNVQWVHKDINSIKQDHDEFYLLKMCEKIIKHSEIKYKDKKKFLILGSEGLIGKKLCEFLISKGHQIARFDIVNSDEQDLRKKINELNEEIYFKDIDFVFFLAYDVGGSSYLSKYEKTTEFLNNNLDIMKNTFELLKKYNKPFIFASSQMSSMNHSAYGCTKKIGEFYTKTLNGINIKFWNVYGAEDPNFPEKFHVVTDFVNSAKNNKLIKCKTSGLEERQMLFVEDSVEALYILSQKYDELDRNEEYDITNFKWNTIREIAELIKKQLPETQLEFNDNLDTVQAGIKNEPSKYILKYWKPKLSLEDGIIKVIKEMEKK